MEMKTDLLVWEVISMTGVKYFSKIFDNFTTQKHNTCQKELCGILSTRPLSNPVFSEFIENRVSNIL